MNAAALDLSILLPALAAGLLVTATHVPLGRQVLERGIVFIDLAIAQIAGVGVILADALGFEPQGAMVQVSALSAALVGAIGLTWSEKQWPQSQEAIIGTVFVLAASAAILLLAANPQGGEHLKELLVGQILWVTPHKLAIVAVVYAVLLAVWFGVGEARLRRAGFYLVFACTVTVSVQLVGLYLVFASLIVPALATRRYGKHRLAFGYAVGAAGYLVGLIVSSLTDLPSGATIVWALACVGLGFRAVAPAQAHHTARVPSGSGEDL